MICQFRRLMAKFFPFTANYWHHWNLIKKSDSFKTDETIATSSLYAHEIMIRDSLKE